MEAASPGAPGARAREADIAPAAEPATRAVGWSPADPGPLGLAAFAATTFLLSMVNSSLVRPASALVVLPVALAYGGVVQVLAGMWEFRTGSASGRSRSRLRSLLDLILLSRDCHAGSLAAAACGFLVPVCMDDLHVADVCRVAANVGCGRVGVLPADGDVPSAGNRERQPERPRHQQHNQVGRLPRARHGGLCVVRSVRRSRQLNLRPQPDPRLSAETLREPEETRSGS